MRCGHLVSGSRAPYYLATRDHLAGKGFERDQIFMLAMPPQGTQSVPAEFPGTAALTHLLPSVSKYMQEHCYARVCLCVDTFRLGENENRATVMQHVGRCDVVVCGYSDWPLAQPGAWWGASFLACGDNGFQHLALCAWQQTIQPEPSHTLTSGWLLDSVSKSKHTGIRWISR